MEPTSSSVLAEILACVPLIEREGPGRVGRVADDTDRASSLDRETQIRETGEKRVLLKTEQYPSGPVRIVLKEVEVNGDPVIVAGRPPRLKRAKEDQERVESSRYRTRKTIRQRCMAMRADHMATLTYKENMQDRDRCYRDTVELIRRARAIGYLPDYVAVPEQQKRGAWHVHIAYRGFIWVNTLRRLWREIVGEYEGKPNGNIDIRYFKGPPSPWRIAAYISKYIGKAIEQSEPGQRTFWASDWCGGAPKIEAELIPPSLGLTQVLVAARAYLAKREDLKLRDEWNPPYRTGPPSLIVLCAA